LPTKNAGQKPAASAVLMSPATSASTLSPARRLAASVLNDTKTKTGGGNTAQRRVISPSVKDVSGTAAVSIRSAVKQELLKPATLSRDPVLTDPVKDLERDTCKPRPDDNKPKSGGSGRGRRFVPWCS